MGAIRRLDCQRWLVAYVREVMGQPYQWGSTDCASLVWGAVVALYEDDARPALRPVEYTSLREAYARHQELGGTAAELEACGARLIVPAYLHDGDIVTAPPSEEDELPAAGVVVSRGVLTSDVERGVWHAPLSWLPEDAELWRLPHG